MARIYRTTPSECEIGEYVLAGECLGLADANTAETAIVTTTTFRDGIPRHRQATFASREVDFEISPNRYESIHAWLRVK